MDANRFDTVTRMFAARRSRRALIQGGAGFAAGMLAANQATAQDATPAPAPGGTAGRDEKTMFLFVQSFQSGSLAPNDDGSTHTLTLEQGLGQTLFFADRPSRDVGAAPSGQFLEGLGFSEENPPNAALIVDAGEGETDLAVLELFAPTYEVATHTATYQVKALQAWEETLELGLRDSPTDLSGVAPEFGAAHLLIDDCPDASVTCFSFKDDSVQGIAGVAGMCWSWSSFICWWCSQDAVDATCNTTFPACDNRCHAAPLPPT